MSAVAQAWIEISADISGLNAELSEARGDVLAQLQQISRATQAIPVGLSTASSTSDAADAFSVANANAQEFLGTLRQVSGYLTGLGAQAETLGEQLTGAFSQAGPQALQSPAGQVPEAMAHAIPVTDLKEAQAYFDAIPVQVKESTDAMDQLRASVAAMPALVQASFAPFAQIVREDTEEVVRFGHGVEQLKEQMDRVRQDRDKGGLMEWFMGITTGIQVFNLLREGVHGVTGSIRSFVDTAAQAEVSTALLNVAITNLGDKIGYTRQEFGNIIELTKGLGVAGQSAVQDAARVLMQSGMIRGQQFQDTLRLAQDMAGLMGGDLTQAAHQLAHALANPEHGMMLLRRAGMGVDQQMQQQIHMMMRTGQFAEAQAIIINKLSDAYRGYGEAFKNTFAGQMTLIQSLLGEASVQLGQAFLPTMKQIAGSVSEFLQSDTWKYWVQLVKGVAQDVVSALTGVANSILPSWQAVRDEVTSILENISAAVHDPKAAFDLVTSEIRAAYTSIVADLLGELNKLAPAATTIWEAMGDALVLALDDAINRVMAYMTGKLQPPAWVQFAMAVSKETTGVGALERLLRPPDKDDQLARDRQQFEESMQKSKNQLQQQLDDANKARDAAQAERDKQRADWQKLRNDVENRARQQVPAPAQAPGGGTPSTDYGQQAMKYSFESISGLWKQIQQSMTGGSMVDLTKAVASNTGQIADGVKQLNEGVNRLVNKPNKPAEVAPG
jgi:X-X-X-Leu-X-X-Gly heptad repeat protein